MLEIILILVYSSLFGLTMKFADLLDEHGMRLFKGDSLVFGLLWGIFGLLSIISNVSVGNLILATVLGFLTRMKLDYRNHAIAASIIVIGFFLFGTFQPLIFLPFYVVFVSLGSIRDFIRYKRLKASKFFKKFEKIFYYDFSYVIPSLVYSLITSDWILSYAAVMLTLFYDVAKFYGSREGHK